MSTFDIDLTKDDYKKLISDSRETVEFFNPAKNKIVLNTYSLFLSNGDRINFSFNENNVPHLLGFKNLERIDKNSRGAYYTLKKLVENDSFRRNTINNIEKREGNFNNYMSKHYSSKIKAIKSQTTAPYPNDVYFVCKFNPAVNYGTGEIDKYNNCEYYIGRKDKDGNLLLLGLVKNNFNIYAPRTNRLINKNDIDEELSKLLQNQTICFVNGLTINSSLGYENKTSLKTTDKMDILQKIINISNKYNASIDCADNFLYDLRGRTRSKASKALLKELLGKMSQSINKSELLDIEDSDLEEIEDYRDDISDLVVSINDRLCVISKNDSVKVRYSQLKKEKEKSEKENNILTKKISSQEDEIKQLKEQLKILKKEKEELVQENKKVNKRILKLEAETNKEKEDE